VSDVPAPRPRRVAAIIALVGYAATLVLIVVAVSDHWDALILAWVLTVVAAGLAWIAATRRGTQRWLAAVAAVVEVVVVVVLLVGDAAVRDVVAVVVTWLVAVLASRYAVHADRAALRAALPPGAPAGRASRAVLLMNPRSGGGKVITFDLPREAARRGIEAVVLAPGDDLEQLARQAVASGVDAVGMAGGDGSQALVAGIAGEHGVPFVCIPAGTRNHLALDLGVDRDDVVGSLDAFTDGYERTIDLATVGGRVFVNNVSLGVYAQIVQSEAYRDQKVGTTATMLPELLGPRAGGFDLTVQGPGAPTVQGPCMVLVSNNVYELQRLGGFGSRARLDEGVLGVVALTVRGATEVAALVAAETAGQVSRVPGWKQWRAPWVEVASGAPIAAGVDGEALVMPSPLRFEIRPAALRVRVARGAPGRSPAASRRPATPRTLLRIAAGRPPR
jgi:diacylglycerol kinase family enzyme